MHRSSAIPSVVLLAGLVTASVLAADVQPWIPDSLRPWLEGVEQLNSARPDAALRWLEAKRRKRPDDPCACYFLALAHDRFDYGDEDRGPSEEELIERGLDLAKRGDSDDPGARYCEGALYGLRTVNRLDDGSYLGAAFDGKRFRRIMLDLKEEHPDFVDTLFWIGTYEYGADVLPGHIKFLKALMFLPGGDRERGFEMLEDVTQRGVLDRLNAHYLLSGFYAEQRRSNDRRRILESFSETYPEFPWATIMLAWLHAATDPPDYQLALALHRKAVERVEAGEGVATTNLVHDTQLSLGGLYQSALDYRKAVETLTPVYEATRGDEEREPRAARLLARSLNRTGRHEEAVTILRGVEQRYPDAEMLEDLRVEVGLLDDFTGRVYEAALPARILARDGETEAAEDAFRQLLVRYPDHPEIHFRMAEMYFEVERYPPAETHFRKAIEGGPELPAYVVPYGHLQLGEICDLTGRRSEAKTFYRQAIDLAGKFTALRASAERYLKKPYPR